MNRLDEERISYFSIHWVMRYRAKAQCMLPVCRGVMAVSSPAAIGSGAALALARVMVRISHLSCLFDQFVLIHFRVK